MVVFDPAILRVKRLLDLSLPISTDTAKYPRDPSPRIEVLNTIDDGGLNTTRIILSGHASTHIDVPYHPIHRAQFTDAAVGLV
ncbi:MAG: cyclase family protein [Halobacteriota archaeon]